MILHTHAYARAGLIGNPSDGYFGKTVSVILKNYCAEIKLFESPELIIEPRNRDISRFESLDMLMQDVRQHGYYGGVRLIKAAINCFGGYCATEGIDLPKKNFTIRYASNIPRLVGMAGSSAIVTATFRALMQFYDVNIPKPIKANLILSAERDELGIGAGLQDRVIQVYEGVVYMDFDETHMKEVGYGRYEKLSPDLLPPLYVAFDPRRSEGSERSHNQVRARFDSGDDKVIETMQEIAALAQQARDLLMAGRGGEMAPLVDQNFDLRKSIFPISPENLRMIETARAAGATAKFSGSGGAIIGTYEGEEGLKRVTEALSRQGCTVCIPEVL